LKKNHAVEIEWLAFPLHPETPERGVSLEKLFSGRNFDIDEVMRHLKGVADGLGLPFGSRKMTYNSRMAQELGKWAEEEGRGDAFHRAAFEAYFVDGKNLASIDLLADIAVSVNLDGAVARRVYKERTYKREVDRDWQEARARGITAVPTFLADGRRLVGAQSYEALAKLIMG